MFTLFEDYVAIDENETAKDIPFVVFNLETDSSDISQKAALKIDFNNNIKYSINIIKKLLTIPIQDYYYIFEEKKLAFIISNYSDEIIQCLKALFISNTNKRINYLYDTICDNLDKIWSVQNPCKFCNNQCVASRNHMTSHKEDGCCYSFEYSKNPFSTSFLKNFHKCKYLGNDKHCTAQNISCKLFTCNYLKKKTSFNINMDDQILINTFFNKKQKLILKYNFFKTKEEIINKLQESNNIPYPIYWYFNKYRI